MTHGGKRPGAGRPKGAKQICDELRQAAQEHTPAAIQTLVDVMNDSEHKQRLRAAELILERGHGASREIPPSRAIIDDFVSGKISAISAALCFEAEGLTVPPIMKMYLQNELSQHDFKPFSEAMDSLEKPPAKIPRE